jgi:hypothetical protein
MYPTPIFPQQTPFICIPPAGSPQQPPQTTRNPQFYMAHLVNPLYRAPLVDPQSSHAITTTATESVSPKRKYEQMSSSKESSDKKINVNFNDLNAIKDSINFLNQEFENKHNLTKKGLLKASFQRRLKSRICETAKKINEIIPQGSESSSIPHLRNTQEHNLMIEVDDEESLSSREHKQKKRKIEEGYSLSMRSMGLGALRSMCQMVNDEKTSDVVFKVEGHEFYAHRAFLANRSDVFKQMFYGNFKETNVSNKLVIEIPEVSVNVFHEFLHYLYTGQLKLNAENFIAIYLLADMYFLEELKTLCRNLIDVILSPSNAILLLVEAHSRHLLRFFDQDEHPVIKEIASYTLGNAQSILTRENQDLHKINPELFWLLLQSDLLSLSETNVVEIVIAWLEKQNQDEDLLSKTKQYIRFPCLPLDFIWNNLKKAQVWDKEFCNQDELIKMSGEAANQNFPKNPRKCANSWLISKCEKPFEVKSLGDDEVMMSFQVLNSVKKSYDTPHFNINKTEWFLRVIFDSTQNLVQVGLGLTSNQETRAAVKVMAQFCLINRDIRKSQYAHMNDIISKIPDGRKRGLVQMSRITDESGFLNEGKIVIQARMKLLK